MWEYGKDGAGYPLVNEGGDMVATMNVTPGDQRRIYCKDIRLDEGCERGSVY